eukprot:TRINITY_DN47723_c0_g1_i1.p1 TRINITY_DN47723_c0_g1~~TRINITY_DN47723_c0_g1_i1.p1  ORF type:complete len:516 (-),score=97.05 TRINITY_DN47723_c0_g1_i1:54-1601(-)
MSTAGFARLRDDAAGPADSPSYEALVAELRATFRSGKTKDLQWRRQQLEAMKRLISENHEEITAAVRADHGGPKIRGIGELNPALAAMDALDHLDAWTAPEKVPTPMVVSPTMMGKSFIRHEPKGVVLIIGPWNFPVELVLHPLVSAIAAGNCAVLKPSEVAPNCGALVERLVNQYLDTSCIKIVQGAVPETSALLKERWDHIFYTGNGHVGRIVLKAAAEHMTPVTLELGGKSPVIVDKSATMKSVIERIALVKWGMNVGQICVSPDYILIHKDREQEFIDGMKAHVETLYGTDPKQSEHFGRIINANHVQRISGLLKETKGQAVIGGIEAVDSGDKYVPPTVVRNAQLGEPLMTEEIFGPVLPVMTIDSIEEAVEKVKGICDQPLALYLFAEDKRVIDYVLDNTSSGGVCVNTTLEHLLNHNLPFGGVGESGCGAYHGKAGFDEFTHRRSVLHQDTTIMKGASIPPRPSDTLYDLAVKATITGFMTDGQKRMIGAGIGATLTAVAALALRSRL